MTTILQNISLSYGAYDKVSCATTGFSTYGSPSANGIMYICLRRNGAGVFDTSAVDMLVSGLRVIYRRA